MDSADFTLKEIKQLLIQSQELPQKFWQTLAADSRVGVQKLRQSFLRQTARQEQEKERWQALRCEEKHWQERGYALVAGVDEAGRGPLAGPVLAAAVILPEEAFLPGLKDSKKLSPAQREKLFVQILEVAVAWNIAEASVAEIDRDNILEASLAAMRRAVDGLEPAPDFVLSDGNFPCRCRKGQEKNLIGGDDKCACIAAASILAKVTRDHLMSKLDQLYPQYGFAQHKGYGTKEHLANLQKYGPCPLHRRSFAPVKNNS